MSKLPQVEVLRRNPGVVAVPRQQKRPTNLPAATTNDARSVAAAGQEEAPLEKWSDMPTIDKLQSVILTLIKCILLLLFLYLFICSLSLLSDALRLLAGRHTNRFFTNNTLLRNPVVSLMLGILATVMVQSSSTSTSITVAMVAADVLPVETAVYIIMGANIGTTVTSTFVSLAHAGRREEFRLAFAGATVGDIFNWLSVLVLLPLEVLTGVLKRMSAWMVSLLHLQSDKNADRQYLKTLTDPLTKSIIQLDSKLLHSIPSINAPATNTSQLHTTGDAGTPRSLLKRGRSYLFANTSLTDAQLGCVMLVISLGLLCTALMLMVRTLNSMLGGHVAGTIRRLVKTNSGNNNNKLTTRQKCWHMLTGYLFILFGTFATVLIQSSSVFTSTLTPLVGIGVVSLERMYPLTLGSDLGTTLTAVLAAFAADAQHLNVAMQVALCHLLLNLIGIAIFYPIPCMRWPVPLARALGDITAKYRWFPVAYILIMFVVVPACVVGLSMAGPIVMMAVGGPVLLALLLALLVTALQRTHPNVLPSAIRSWNWLPLPLRSLEPYDRCIRRCNCYRGIMTFFGRRVGDEQQKNGNDLTERKAANDVATLSYGGRVMASCNSNDFQAHNMSDARRIGNCNGMTMMNNVERTTALTAGRSATTIV